MNVRRAGINMLSGGAGYILPMAINLISTPFVLNKLGKEAFGLQIIANVVIGYLIVADMGLDIPVTHKIADYHARGYLERKSKFLVATVKIYILIGIAGMIALMLLTDKLIIILAIPASIMQEAKIVFYLCGFGFFGSIVTMWGKAVFNGLHRYDIANGISVCNNLFGVVVGIVLISNDFGIIGFFAARVAGFLISGFIYILLAGKNFIAFTFFPIIDREVWDLLKKQIGYGFTLRLSGMIFSRVDQALISAWVGITAVTVYSFPMLIASSISGLLASLTHFAFPMVASLTATGSKEAIELFFHRITKFIVSISTLAFFPFIVFGDKFLALWINQEIATNSHIVLIYVMIGFYLNACLTIGLNAFIVGMGELKHFTFYSISRGIMLFIGFATLIGPFGIEGAGISYLCALLADAIFFAYSLRKKLGFDIRHVLNKGYLKPILLGIVLTGFMLPLRGWVSTWIELIVVVTLYSLLYISLGYFIGILTESEEKSIVSLLKKVRLMFKY